MITASFHALSQKRSRGLYIFIYSCSTIVLKIQRTQKTPSSAGSYDNSYIMWKVSSDFSAVNLRLPQKPQYKCRQIVYTFYARNKILQVEIMLECNHLYPRTF